jgi:hypothetical protein
MWQKALLLFAAAQMPIDNYLGSDPALVRLLDRTVWIDIGLGQTLGQLNSREIAALKTCKQPSMGFEITQQAIVQTFYAGVALRTNYASAATQSDRSGTTILLYLRGNSGAAETLHLSEGGAVLVQQTPGFRPHTFLKCVFPPEKPAGNKSSGEQRR